jgi:hypothetical protein
MHLLLRALIQSLESIDEAAARLSTENKRAKVLGSENFSIKHFKTSKSLIRKLLAQKCFKNFSSAFAYFTFQWNRLSVLFPAKINRLAYINKFFDGS